MPDGPKPGRTLKEGKSGKTMTEGDLLAHGATQKEIDAMLAQGLVKDITTPDKVSPSPSEPAPKKEAVTPGQLGGIFGSQPSGQQPAASGPTDPAPGDAAPALDLNLPGVPMARTGTPANSFGKAMEDQYADTPTPAGAKNKTQPAAPEKPGFTGFLDRMFGRFDEAQKGKTALDDFKGAKSEPDKQTDTVKLAGLSKLAVSEMSKDAAKYFDVIRPGKSANLPTDPNPFGTHETDPDAPDEKYTHVNEGALDDYLSKMRDPATGKPLTGDMRQDIRNTVLHNVESARGDWDAVQAARRNYRLLQPGEDYTHKKKEKPEIRPMNDPFGDPTGANYDLNAGLNPEDPPPTRDQILSQDPNRFVKPGAGNGFMEEMKLQQNLQNGSLLPKVDETPYLHDATGKRTDAVTIATQNVNDAFKGPEIKEFTDLTKLSLDEKEKELSQAITDGTMSRGDADKQYKDYQVKAQGDLKTLVERRVQSLNKRMGIPAVYQAEIDHLEKQIADEDQAAKPFVTPGFTPPQTDDRKAAVARIAQLKALQASGDYNPKDDSNWNRAMQAGVTEIMIAKNEKLKEAFNNMGMTGDYMDQDAHLRGVRNFTAKQMQGFLYGIGGIEAMSGAVLNMLGAYGAGNKLTKRGKEYADANGIPMPIDEHGETVVVDDDVPTWIARNVSAQIPLIAALGGTANITGSAMTGFLEGAGVFKKVSPFIEGAIGGGIEAVPESIMEAADSYNQYIDEGNSVQTARNKAQQVFNENIIMTEFINPLEFGLMKLPSGGKLGRVMKGGVVAGLNGGQEIIQNWIQERQTDPQMGLWQYAVSPEGLSTGLSGMAVGVLQSSIMGSIQKRVVNNHTAGMFSFDKLYNDQNNQDLPDNKTIAHTIRNAYMMHGVDTESRTRQLKGTISRLRNNGTYNQSEFNRMNALIDDVSQVVGNVPQLGSDEQQTAAFNEMMQIHTNNKFARRSGLKSVADEMEKNNLVSTDRINRIVQGTEPLYFGQGREMKRDDFVKYIDELDKMGVLSSKDVSLKVSNDPATQKLLVDRINEAKSNKKESAKAVKEIAKGARDLAGSFEVRKPEVTPTDETKTETTIPTETAPMPGAVEQTETGTKAAPVVEPAITPGTETAQAPGDLIEKRRKDLFPDNSSFADVIGDSGSDSAISNYHEAEGIGVAQYANPTTGDVDVIMSGTSDNDYVGFVRIYEGGKPTNRWTSKMENKSRNKAGFKTMLSEAQKLLPEGHEYTEKTNISLDGLRVYNEQMKHGYEIALDEKGKPIMSRITVNAASVESLRNATDEQSVNSLYDSMQVKSREQYNEIKEKVKAIFPQAKMLPLNLTNGKVEIDLPVLKSTRIKTTQTKAAPAIEATDNLEDSGKNPTGQTPETAPETKPETAPETKPEIKPAEQQSAQDIEDGIVSQEAKISRLEAAKDSKAFTHIDEWVEDRKTGKRKKVNRPRTLAETKAALVKQNKLIDQAQKELADMRSKIAPAAEETKTTPETQPEAEYETADEEQTIFGKPEKVLSKKVEDLANGYETKIERAGGEEEFEKFSEQMGAHLKSEFSKAGLDQALVTDEVRDKFVGEVYDMAGAAVNSEKTGRQVMNDFIEGYKGKRAPATETKVEPEIETTNEPANETESKTEDKTKPETTGETKSKTKPETKSEPKSKPVYPPSKLDSRKFTEVLVEGQKQAGVFASDKAHMADVTLRHFNHFPAVSISMVGKKVTVRFGGDYSKLVSVNPSVLEFGTQKDAEAFTDLARFLNDKLHSETEAKAETKSEPVVTPASAPATEAEIKAKADKEAHHAKLLEDKKRKTEAFRKASIEARSNLNSLSNVGATGKWIATGIDLLGTYTELGIVKIKDVFNEAMTDLGKEFMDSHVIDGLRRAYASFRSDQSKENRKNYSTDDEVDDFITDELPAMLLQDQSDPGDVGPVVEPETTPEIETESEPVIEPGYTPKPAVELGKLTYKLIGLNQEGVGLYENEEGLRAVDNGKGIYAVEKVKIRGFKDGINYDPKLDRESEYLTPAELEEKSREPVVIDTALDEIAAAFSNRFGTNVKIVSQQEAEGILEDQNRELFFQILDDVDLFEDMAPAKAEAFILRVFKTVADAEEAKKAYRKLAIKYHPDKQGSTQIMQYLNNTYDDYKDGKLFSGGARNGGFRPGGPRSNSDSGNDYSDPYGAAADWMKQQKAKADQAGKAYEQAQQAKGKAYREAREKAEEPFKGTGETRAEAQKRMSAERDQAITDARRRRDSQLKFLTSQYQFDLAALETSAAAEYKEIGPELKDRDRLKEAHEANNQRREKIKADFEIARRKLEQSYKTSEQAAKDKYAEKFKYQIQGEGAFPAGFYDPKTRTAYLVRDRVDATTPIHEIFSHPFIEAMENVNPELLQNIVKEAATNEDVMQFVFDNYGELDKRSFAHEIVARAIDLEAKKQLAINPNKTLIDYIRDFWKQATEIFHIFTGNKASVENIKPDTQIKDIVHFLLKSGDALNLAVEKKVTEPAKSTLKENKAIKSEWGKSGQVEMEQHFKNDLSAFSRSLQEATGWEAGVYVKGKNKGRAINVSTVITDLGGEGVISLYAPGSNYGVTMRIPVTRSTDQDGNQVLIAANDIEYRLASREDPFLGLPITTGLRSFTVEAMAEKLPAMLEGFDENLKPSEDGTKTDTRDTDMAQSDGDGPSELAGAGTTGQVEGTIPGRGSEDVLGQQSAGSSGDAPGATTGGKKSGGSKRGGKRSDNNSGDTNDNDQKADGQKRNNRDKGKSDRVKPEDPSKRNHIIEPSDTIVPKGNVARVDANMDALLLLRKLEAEGRDATVDEKKILARLSGWGMNGDYLKGIVSDPEAQEIAQALFSGGDLNMGYSWRKVELKDLPALDQTTDFATMIKTLQRRYAELMQANPALREQVISEYEKGLPLDVARAALVKMLHTDTERETAINSTISAFDTPRDIVTRMWDLARRLGFSGGKVMENSAGIGHFFGLMPQDLASASDLTGIELDSVRGRVLQKLYPEGNMVNKGFQYTTFPLNSQDLIIGNVPFGRAGLLTDVNNKDISGFSMNNYFIARSLKLLKPGGIAVLITSKATMDSDASIAARRWFSNVDGGNSDFIGAVRMPNTAFSENSGTQVTSDVLIFQKRKDGVARNLHPFINTRNIVSEVRDDTRDGPQVREIDVNEYFVNNPQNMIGEMRFAGDVGKGGLHTKWDSTLEAAPGTDVMARLSEITDTMPADIVNTDKAEQGKLQDIKTNEDEGRMFEEDGQLYISEGETATPVTINGKPLAKDRIKTAKMYLKLRDEVRAQIELEQDPDSTDEQIEASRGALNKTYDNFLARANDLKKGSLFHAQWLTDLDQDFSLISQIETVETKIKTRTTDGAQEKYYEVGKGDILNKRVNFPRRAPTSAENLDDALQISMAYRGVLNEDYMASLLGITPEEVRTDLLSDEKVFENPANGLLELPEDYLSGYVRRKLEDARLAAETDPRYLRNVYALTDVIPNGETASQINVKMGANWIPADIYTDFFQDFFGVTTKAAYAEGSGEWSIEQLDGKGDSRNLTTYAVGGVTGMTIAEHVMNSRPTKIRREQTNKETGKVESVIDEARTAEAADMQNTIIDSFLNWVRNHEEHGRTMEDKFNDRFKGFVERKQPTPYFKHFPGSNHAITLRIHQARGAMRAVVQNLLLAHAVGTGKTMTLITAAMEMRRLGTAKKVMLAVKNKTLGGFEKEARNLYPGARILIPSKFEMTAKGRKQFFGRIATGDWDLIIVPHSQMALMPDDPVRIQSYLRERIAEMQATVESMDGSEPFHYKKNMQADIKKLQDQEQALFEEEYVINPETGQPLENADGTFKKLTKEQKKAIRIQKRKNAKEEGAQNLAATARVEKQASRRVDKVMYFDDFGVDALMVDESHEFKKLGFFTSREGVKGIDVGASQKALSVLMKVRAVRDKTGGKNVIFSTGTPVTNTMGELWTNMRFIAPEMLESLGIQHFDQFVDTFAQIIPSVDRDPGGKAVINSRLGKFFNLPELMTAFRSMADVVTVDDIPEFRDDPAMAPPLMRNQTELHPKGRPTMFFVPISKPLAVMMRRLNRRYNDWKNFTPFFKRANRAWPLMLTEIGKIAAIDIRLIDPSAPDDPDSKVNNMLREALKNYKDYDKYKGTQMIFSDNYQSGDSDHYFGLAGVGEAGRSAANFDLYQDIKKKLIAGGVPAEQIAIANDKRYKDAAANLNLQQAMNDGTVRFMIGSTDIMGIGINAHKKMIALHMLDGPDRPDQFEQRVGRILRQGNVFATLGIPVDVLTYGIKGTRDATVYDRLRFKNDFIKQLMKGYYTTRDSDDPAAKDIDAGDTYFDEIGAALTGSRNQMDLVMNNNDLRQEKNRQSAFETRKKETNNRLRKKQDQVADMARAVEEDKALEAIKKERFPDDGRIANVTIEGKNYTQAYYEVLDKKIKDAKEALGPNMEKVAQMSLKEKQEFRSIINIPFEINGVATSIDVWRQNTLGSTKRDELVDDRIDSNGNVWNLKANVPSLNIIGESMGADSAASYFANMRRELAKFDGLGARTQKAFDGLVRDIKNLKSDLEATFDTTKINTLQAEVDRLVEAIVQEGEEEARAEDQEEDPDYDSSYGRSSQSDTTSQEDPANPSPQGLGASDVDEEAADIDQEILKARQQLRNLGNDLSSMAGIMSLPHLTKLAYLYIRKGLRSASQFARAMGERYSKAIVQAWNTAYHRYQARHGRVGLVLPAVSGAGTGAGTGATGSTGSTGGSPRSRLAAKRKKALDSVEKMMKDYQMAIFKRYDINDKRWGVNNVRLMNLVNLFSDATAKKAAEFGSAAFRKMSAAAMEKQNGNWGKFIIRPMGKAMNMVFANIAKDSVTVDEAETMTGAGRVKSITEAVRMADILRKMIDNSSVSLKKINQVVDPEFYNERTMDEWEDIIRNKVGDEAFDALDPSVVKTSYAEYRLAGGFDDPTYRMATVDDLTPQEKSVYEHIRMIYDMMHEINFSIGKLTEETYDKNKGVYSARLYERYELPKEVENMMKGGPLKTDESLYMEKGELDDWKLTHGIMDPVYTVAKRLAQTMSNKAIHDYAEHVSKHVPGAVSTTEKGGYRKLGYGYGALSKKWVRDDIAEDFFGHFYANAVMQKIYDVLKAYDRFTPRQFQKKLFTVLNPGTHVGNIAGNFMFGWMVGINPIRLGANVPWALRQMELYSAEYSYALEKGLLGTDSVTNDLKGTVDVPIAPSAPPPPPGTPPPVAMGITGSGIMDVAQKIYDPIAKFYQGTDDVLKMAALKSLLDLGYTPREAVNKVKDGFQNYKRVGKAYGLFSKIPIIGPPFGGFAGDLMRIVGKGAITRPLHMAAMFALLKTASYLMSRWAGEPDEDKRLRESRAGFPMIPLPEFLGGPVPLEWKTKWGTTVNVGRLLSPAFLYSDGSGDDSYSMLQKFSPMPFEGVKPWEKNPDRTGVLVAKNVNDPLFAGLFQWKVNADFRGVPISDPKVTRYKDSEITSEERAGNEFRFLARSYIPYYGQVDDFKNAWLGKPDYYNRERSPGQVLMQFFVGVKLQNFPETKYGRILSQKMDSYGYLFQKEGRMISHIKKEYEKDGLIDYDTFLKRITPHIARQNDIVADAEGDYKKLTGKVGGLDLTKQDVINGVNYRSQKKNPEGGAVEPSEPTEIKEPVPLQ